MVRTIQPPSLKPEACNIRLSLASLRRQRGTAVHRLFI